MRNLWPMVRILFLALWAAAGFIGFESQPPSPKVPLAVYVAAFLWPLLMLRFWIVRTYISPERQQPSWRPSWVANPFHPSQPFQFFHLAGLSFVTFSLAAVLRNFFAVTNGGAYHVPDMELLAGAFGLGGLCGVYWAVRRYESRFTVFGESEA